MDLVASPSRRLLAGAIDVMILIAARLGLDRLRGRPWLDSSPAAQREDLAVAGCYFVAGTALAGRTAGQAVLGLRTVSEVTGRRPGWRASMIRWAVRLPPQLVLMAVFGSSFMRRNMEQMREAKTEIDKLRHGHGRDQQEIDNALIDLYQTRRISPRGCWPLLAAVLIGAAYDGIVTVGVLRPPKRQGLHDRLAHVLVLQDDVQRSATSRP
ncbi:MAG: RDD family protein [Pseudonocardiaceae bacterium]